MKSDKYFVRDIPRRKFLEMSLKGGIVMASTPALLSQLVSCQPMGASASGLDIDKETLKNVIAAALENGGDFAEVYLENRVSRNIVMEESSFKSGLYGVSQGGGVRVISGNKTGYAYTDDITPENLMRAAKVASYVAKEGKSVGPIDINEASRTSFVSVAQPLNDI